LIDRIVRPWLLINSIYELTESATEERNQKERLDSFARNLIQKHRDAAYKSPRICLLDYMIQIADEHPDFTDDDIIDEGNQLFIDPKHNLHNLFNNYQLAHLCWR